MKPTQASRQALEYFHGWHIYVRGSSAGKRLANEGVGASGCVGCLILYAGIVSDAGYQRVRMELQC
jgi:hypothetical protein